MVSLSEVQHLQDIPGGSDLPTGNSKSTKVPFPVEHVAWVSLVVTAVVRLVVEVVVVTVVVTAVQVPQTLPRLKGLLQPNRVLAKYPPVEAQEHAPVRKSLNEVQFESGEGSSGCSSPRLQRVYGDSSMPRAMTARLRRDNIFPGLEERETVSILEIY